LRPGLAGLSDNIRVTSIVGRFLEHSRIFYFGNGGHEEIYLGSADLMPRNLNRRVEVLFPITSPRLVGRVRDEILEHYLADESNARHMGADGSYTPKRLDGGFDSQAWFLGQHGARTAVVKSPVNGNGNGRHAHIQNQNMPLQLVRQQLADLRSITQAFKSSAASWPGPRPEALTHALGESLSPGAKTESVNGNGHAPSFKRLPDELPPDTTDT